MRAHGDRVPTGRLTQCADPRLPFHLHAFQPHAIDFGRQAAIQRRKNTFQNRGGVPDQTEPNRTLASDLRRLDVDLDKPGRVSQLATEAKHPV